MKHLIPSLRMLLFMTLLTGVAYPLSITLIAQIIFPYRANGSLVLEHGKVVGSGLIAQKFKQPKYFWPRPSAGDFNPLPSGGSNQGQISVDLKKVVNERSEKLKAAHGVQNPPPQDLIFASASGLDPHISPEAARYQLDRVALARNMSGEQKDKLKALLDKKVEGRTFGILGEPRINVLELNLALDHL